MAREITQTSPEIIDEPFENHLKEALYQWAILEFAIPISREQFSENCDESFRRIN